MATIDSTRAMQPALGAEAGALAANVVRNTYLLLAMTVAFSALAAGASMALRLPHPGVVVTLVGYFGLLFLVARFRDRALGVGLVFALTGFMGYTLGPIVNHYLGLPDGVRIVATALAGTAAIFVGLSAYALTTRRDLTALGSFLAVGILLAFLAGLAALFFEMPALSIAVSALFVLLMAGWIVYQTNAIVRGGETNYVMATVSLYVSIFNLFTSLPHLLGFAGGDE
jgi:modulator of FtsH protease